MVSFTIDSSTTLLIVVCGVVSLLFAAFQFLQVSKVKLEEDAEMTQSLIQENKQQAQSDGLTDFGLIKIYETIREGADSFLRAEYKICTYFIIIFGLVVFFLTSSTIDDVTGKQKMDYAQGAFTAIAFVFGAVASMLCGWIGMKVAVFANARTAVSASLPEGAWQAAFNCAFRAGGVMGYFLCGCALLTLYLICCVYASCGYFTAADMSIPKVFECVAGFGLGGSSIAMFGRVGGGIYTKAADVGADLAGKVVEDLPEDDPRNPAVIADNVGDNVGDVAGMGSDLFGSFAEASCAALVVVASIVYKDDSGAWTAAPDWKALMFPVMVSAVGAIACMACSFIATHVAPVHEMADVEKTLKVQLVSTAVVISIIIYPLAHWAFDGDFRVHRAGSDDALNPSGLYIDGSALLASLCVWVGLWAGCAIGFITEYFTSHSWPPTREVAGSCGTAATNIIYGLALGYKSCIAPVFLLSLTVWISFEALDMLGVALAALGMLSNLATCLSIDVYGPVCDNAGGIAEMSHMPETTRDITDALDAAGNTTAAIGKGFAIGSACLVGLALFGAFIQRSKLSYTAVSLLDPIIFAFLLIGAMIPYWFSAMTMKAVGIAANEMVEEVARQFKTLGILDPNVNGKPDYKLCIDISTKASLKMMVAPSILVMGSPILTGVFFGTSAVAGLLSGAIASSIQMAISASNTGGAWDNAKKYIESGQLEITDSKGNKHTVVKNDEHHKNAVIGDTVGDPLKDTSGPALNIVMKLMAILSLVFADFFASIKEGKGLISWNRTVHSGAL